VQLTASTDPCPACAGPLTRPNIGQPWCVACEWNLGVYDPAVIPARGWRWLSRVDHGLAFRLDRELSDAFAAERPEPGGWTPARAILVGVSALLVLLILACAGLGIELIAVDFPSLTIVPGVLLILLAVALRPRFTRRPERRLTLRREQAPMLFALVDRVAAAVGGPAPRVLAVAPEFNASAARVGLRQVPALVLGIPLWITLGPSLRVALLAHELAHQVNGDPTRGLLVRPALDTFRELARSTGAERTAGEIASPDRPGANFFVMILELALWAISRVFLLVYLGLCALALRDHQRAEYLADAKAADAAGSAGMVELLDRLVLLHDTATLIAYNAATRAPARWRGMAESLCASRAGDLPALRQLTMRETSVWRSHPPSGLRARVIEAWPARQPLVELTEEESARIDAELAGWYGATHRRMLGAEDYRGER